MIKTDFDLQQKITFFIPSLRAGGAERVFVNLVNYFVKKGFLVDLVIPSIKGQYVSQVDRKVRIIDLGAHRVATSLVPFIQYLQREKPIAVYSTLDHANLIVIVSKIIARYQGKIIIRVANTLSQSLRGTSLLKRYIRKYGILLLYPKADHIVTNSVGSMEDLQHFIRVPENKRNIIYNAVNFSDIEEKARQHPEHKWFQDPHNNIILAVGKIHEQKDYPTLLRAFSLVRKEKNVKLIILGRVIQDTELKKMKQILLEEHIQDDVDIVGHVDNPYSYMSHAHLYVLSSRWEGSPNTLIEALACNVPVVSTDCPSGPREILDNGTYGILVPVGDSITFADAINNNISKHHIHDMDQVRSHLKKMFSVDTISDQYLKLLDI